MKVIAYHGSAGVLESTKKWITKKMRMKMRDGTSLLKESTEKTNGDTFANFRAQSWYWIRERFELTHDAVQRAQDGHIVTVNPEDFISIDSQCECLQELQAELSRPMRVFTDNGKIKVESKKAMKARGVDSPNLADALVIAMSIKRPAISSTKKPTPLPGIVRRHVIHDKVVNL